MVLKFIIALAAKFQRNIFQLDIRSTHLNARLNKEIYTTIPPGDPNYNKGFWRLKKSLYGLICIIGLYVDDMIITGEQDEIHNVIKEIKMKFKISKYGTVDSIQGINVKWKNILHIQFPMKIL